MILLLTILSAVVLLVGLGLAWLAEMSDGELNTNPKSETRNPKHQTRQCPNEEIGKRDPGFEPLAFCRVLNLFRISDFGFRISALLLLSSIVHPPSSSAEIIPATRLTTWPGNAGIPGGIPNNWPIWTNMVGLDTNAGVNVAGRIQNALDRCPTGQVVKLPAGRLRIDNTKLQITRSIILRGAGMNQTFLIGQASDNANSGGLLWMHGQSVPTSSMWFNNILSGANQGSTNISVAADSGNHQTWLHPGDIVFIDEVDDGVLVTGEGMPNDNRSDTSPRGSLGGLTHHHAQFVEILTVKTNSTAFTFRPPIAYGFTNTPQLGYRKQTSTSTTYLRSAGIEDLALTNTYNGANYQGDPSKNQTLVMDYAAYCWLKNVAVYNGVAELLQVNRSFAPEIRGCTFSNCVIKVTSGGYGLDLEVSSWALIIDNIIVHSRDWIRVDGASTGNAILYNYHTNALANQTAPHRTENTGGHHSCHPIMTLFEGNVGYSPRADNSFGTSSHGTYLRNWFRGPRGTNDEGAAYLATIRGYALEFRDVARYNNVVGNVFGRTDLSTSGVWPNRTVLKTNAPFSTGDYAAIVIGQDADGSFVSTSAVGALLATHIIGGNYDIPSGTTNWYNGLSSTNVIPDSYFYTAKPDFFGGLTWPPIAPTGTTHGETNIPAGWRWRFGTNPPAGLLAPSHLQIDLGSLPSGESDLRYAWFTNVGLGSLTLTPLNNRAGFAYTGFKILNSTNINDTANLFDPAGLPPTTIAPGQTITLSITFISITDPLSLNTYYYNTNLLLAGGGGATIACQAVTVGYGSSATNMATQSDFTVTSGAVAALWDSTPFYSGQSGEAWIGFTLTNRSIVTLSAYVQATNATGNSFGVEIDGEPAYPNNVWNVTATGEAFETQTVDLQGVGSAAAPDQPANPWLLEAGTHYVKIFSMTADTKIQSVTLASVHPITPQIIVTGLGALSGGSFQ